MSDLLKRIADYFTNEYQGDDKTAPKMELSVDDLRYIASMNVDRCRAETELREAKKINKIIADIDFDKMIEILHHAPISYGYAYDGIDVKIKDPSYIISQEDMVKLFNYVRTLN